MSARQSGAPAARQVRSRPAGPALRQVALPSSTAPRAPFVILVVLVLAVGLVGLVLLSTSLQQGSFVIRDLERSNAALRDQRQALAQKVDKQESPEVLAARARDLGMVPSPRRAFLRLPDGKVIGEAVKASAPPRPVAPAAGPAVPRPPAAEVQP